MNTVFLCGGAEMDHGSWSNSFNPFLKQDRVEFFLKKFYFLLILNHAKYIVLV